ncbi:MAG: hypothetical protein PHV95_10985 [Eubacteriales bacterium]|nr:hypothetical protein [Eubacteriales bacterium]
MRKVFIILILIIMLFSCCDVDTNKGKRPNDYPNTTWICDHYNAKFDINSNNQIVNGQITINNENISFTIIWSNVDSKAIFMQKNDSNDKEKQMFIGKCTFKSSEFKIKITEKNNYFDSNVTMTFKRNY